MSDKVIIKDDVLKVIKAINALTGKQVLVGIPQTTTDRQDEEQGAMNNATLGYIHEHGSPINNIPARPFLVPGVQDVEGKIGERMKKAGKAALDGDKSKAEEELEKAGLVAQNSVRDRLTNGDFAPLSEATIRARARKGRKGAIEELASRAAGNEPNPANVRPLIDTGQLRQSITYVVRKK